MRIVVRNCCWVCVFIFFCFSFSIKAQEVDTVTYIGSTLSNIDYHHGELSPAVGVHARQIMRASREHPETADDFGWTYNHQPMLAYWNSTFWLEYLSDPVGEHEPPGHTLLMRSKDGKEWDKPTVVFPKYKIPDGFQKEGRPEVAKDLYAVMHQRVGFYVGSNNHFLVSGFYGVSMGPHDSPNDGKGIGRVVREIYKDGSFGPIYFLRFNKRWNDKNTSYPFFKKSKDKAFVAACEEILSKPLMMQQWVEEADRDDPLIPLKDQFKAFSYYHLPDDRVVGLWKHALTSMSFDNGKTWEYHPLRAPGFVNSNAKIWGQQTSDGKYATVYNPSEFRWPLGISTSKDGIHYEDLLLVHGEISPMRYGGSYKSYGPQYVRGILEGNGTPPGGDLWVTYSMNKEDIWVAKIPLPVTDKAAAYANYEFDDLPDGEELDDWNYYDLKWASVKIEKKNQHKWLVLRDKDAFDYARAERVIPKSKRLHVNFTVMPGQNEHGMMQIEFENSKGLPAVRLIFDEDGALKLKAGYRFKHILDYEPGKEYEFDLKMETVSRSYVLTVNGEHETQRVFYAPIHAFERIMFRTGEERHFPNADTPADNYEDLEDTGKQIPEAAFYIKGLKTNSF